jgi:hypothetical protein
MQMIVQIGALRHALEEVMQGKRVAADTLKLMHRALGGSGLRLLRGLCRGGRCQEQRHMPQGNQLLWEGLERYAWPPAR